LAVQHIHAFLVHPGKGAGRTKRPMNGTEIKLNHPTFNLLNDIYTRSEQECDIDIMFRPRRDGTQQNDCRDLLVGYLGNPDLPTAQLIAERLRDTTDGRSGPGLLFLIRGIEGTRHKVVISRFPTDSAIYVEETAAVFTVEYLERVFMKNKMSYKAVVYSDTSLQGGFWTGKAVDKQLNSSGGQQSDYWIAEFLISDFANTPAAGTRRLAVALREATRKGNLAVKQELIAAAALAENLKGKKLSINGFAEQFHLSQSSREAIVQELKVPRTAQDAFEFDLREFRNHIAYKVVELNDGAMLTAISSDFDDIFEQRKLEGPEHEVEFTTRGAIVNEKLRTTNR
jgi:hypothetical protein